MLDKNEKRTLDYEQFGRLVMAVVAASNAPFDQVVDDLVFALTVDDPIPESELQALYIADSMYEGVLDLQRKEHQVSDLMDPLIYGRIQPAQIRFGSGHAQIGQCIRLIHHFRQITQCG